MNFYKGYMSVGELLDYVILDEINGSVDSLISDKDAIIKKVLSGELEESLMFSANNGSIIFGKAILAVLTKFVDGLISFNKSKKKPFVYFEDLTKREKKNLLNFEIKVLTYKPTIFDKVYRIFNSLFFNKKFIEEPKKYSDTLKVDLDIVNHLSKLTEFDEL